MRKTKFSALLLSLLLTLSLSAAALDIIPYYNTTTQCLAKLNFSGTTANCRAIVEADAGSDIDGALTLYRVSGSSPVKVGGWTISGTTEVDTTKTCGVTRGQTYQLVLTVTVDGPGGVDNITKEATATCN